MASLFVMKKKSTLNLWMSFF